MRAYRISRGSKCPRKHRDSLSISRLICVVKALRGAKFVSELGGVLATFAGASKDSLPHCLSRIPENRRFSSADSFSHVGSLARLLGVFQVLLAVDWDAAQEGSWGSTGEVRLRSMLLPQRWATSWECTLLAGRVPSGSRR